MQKSNQIKQILGQKIENWSDRKIPSSEIMRGRYCQLEALDINVHAPKLYESFKHNNQGETWTYLPFGPFETYQQFVEWLSNDILIKIYFVIVHLSNHIPVGLAAYHDIDFKHGVIEVGSIHFSKILQKTCTATEAMYLMMNRVFEEFGYRRYQWRCNALNQASRRAAERLGFQFEGIFRQSNVYKGYNRDTAWYSIIDSEWPLLKMKFEKWLERVLPMIARKH